MSLANGRNRALITGAGGGMGRACARQLGVTMDLVLTDASPALKDFARDLESEGYTVRGCIVGDFASPEVIDALAEEAAEGFSVLVHACGLGPSAEWRQIMQVNYVATVRLLDALAPWIGEGAVAILIASVAGHMAPEIAEVEQLLATPGSPSLLDDLEPMLRRILGPAERGMGTLSYGLSKRKVIDLCEARAAEWGAKGARIVSVSPGLIYTPMGRREAEVDPAADSLVASAPAGRWGTAGEIAAAVAFLASPAAAFMTGADLRIDGGIVGAFRAYTGDAWLNSLRDRMA